uniref:Chorismate synthase 2 n=1 Tax=Arundo donax TaxID=35708 RepID=A0A0A9CMH1_ARUDO
MHLHIDIHCMISGVQYSRVYAIIQNWCKTANYLAKPRIMVDEKESWRTIKGIFVRR